MKRFERSPEAPTNVVASRSSTNDTGEVYPEVLSQTPLGAEMREAPMRLLETSSFEN